MKLSWLESFVVLAEHCSLRTASAQLGLAPASLSAQINALEADLNVKLFNREAKGTSLTAQGYLFLGEAHKIINQWHGIVGNVQATNTTQTKSLRLAFQERTLPPLVGRFMDDFLIRHPDITPSLYNDQEISIAEGLNSGHIDLYFAYCPNEYICSSIVHRPVFHTCLGVLVPDKHRLAWNTSVSLCDLDGETILIYPETQETSLRDRELAALRAAGIRYTLFDGYLSPMYYTLPVPMGQGVAIIPWLLRKRCPPRTVAIPLNDPLCQCSIEMLYHPENNNPALQLFLKEFGDQKGVDDF